RVGQLEVDTVAANLRGAVAGLDLEILVQLLQRETAELRLPRGARGLLLRRDRNTHVVGMDRQLEREMERLPARGVRTDARIDVAPVSSAEAFPRTRARRAPLVDQLRGRVAVELTNAELVRRREIGRTLRSDAGEKVGDGPVE